MAKKFARVEMRRLEAMEQELDFRWSCYRKAVDRLTDDERKDWEIFDKPADTVDGRYVVSEWIAYRHTVNTLEILGFEWRRSNDGSHGVFEG